MGQASRILSSYLSLERTFRRHPALAHDKSPPAKHNMAKVTEDAIQINLPFAAPALGIPEPTTISINKANLQLLVRVLVGVCALLLFWPKVKSAFGFTSKRDMEAETRDIQERIAKLEQERNRTQ